MRGTAPGIPALCSAFSNARSFDAAAAWEIFQARSARPKALVFELKTKIAWPRRGKTLSYIAASHTEPSDNAPTEGSEAPFRDAKRLAPASAKTLSRTTAALCSSMAPATTARSSQLRKARLTSAEPDFKALETASSLLLLAAMAADADGGRVLPAVDADDGGGEEGGAQRMAPKGGRTRRCGALQNM